ncbi:DUF2635 domain-containing protein [bacterium]|nr:DUF2635 domain-containing protein [bacterium]
MKRAFLVPAEGALVRYPNNPQMVLAEAGANVVLDSYWRRRINDGSVVVGKAPVKKVGAKQVQVTVTPKKKNPSDSHSARNDLNNEDK